MGGSGLNRGEDSGLDNSLRQCIPAVRDLRLKKARLAPISPSIAESGRLLRLTIQCGALRSFANSSPGMHCTSERGEDTPTGKREGHLSPRSFLFDDASMAKGFMGNSRMPSSHRRNAAMPP